MLGLYFCASFSLLSSQEVFPSLYGKKFDSALQSLMGEFLSRLEKMLPVPDFKEVYHLLMYQFYALLDIQIIYRLYIVHIAYLFIMYFIVLLYIMYVYIHGMSIFLPALVKLFCL